MTKLKVGIAGFGIVGKRRKHFINLNEHLHVTALCDQKFKDQKTCDEHLPYYVTVDDMIAHEELDVLFVCMSNDIAAEVVIKGLKKGAHVFCEKPPGRDVSDIRSVIEVEKQFSDSKLMYGFNHRYHHSVQEALSLVRKGDFGKVINLRGIYGKSKMINFETDWRSNRKIAGGGILLDQGIHMVDLMRLFAGEFVEYHSYVSNSFWNHDVEDNAYSLMRTQDGVVAMLHSSATQWRHKFQLDITLQRGQIVLSGILSGTKSYGAETLTVVYPHEHDDGDPRETMVRYNHDPSWQDEISYFTDCIVKNQPVISGSSVEALKTMETVYKIYHSDENWRNRYNITLD